MPCLLVLLMLFSAYPYLFCFFLGFPSENVMIISFIVIFAIYCLHAKNGTPGGIPHIGNIMMSQCFVWLFYSLIHQDSSYIVRIILLAETYLALLLLFKKNVVFRFASIFNWSLAIQGVLGVIAFFLLFEGLISPIAEYYFNDTRYEFCYLLTCSNTVQGNFMRVGGYFDEPGALAYWGVFALVINKITYNNKFVEFSLLFALLFTFSAAYFIILPIYVILFYYKNIKMFFLVLLIAIPILYATWNLFSSSYDVALYTTERFQGGTIQTTRFQQQEIAKQLFFQSPIIGNGAREIVDNHRNAEENPFEILAKDGIIGFFFTYIPIIFIFFRYRHDKHSLFGALLLSIDYLQRPFHVNQMQYFMLYFFFTLVILRNQNINTYEIKMQKSNE